MKIRFIVIGFFVMLLCNFTVMAIQINTSMDTWVLNTAANTNYGNNANLQAKTKLGGDDCYAYLGFNLSSYVGSTVTEANLSLRENRVFDNPIATLNLSFFWCNDSNLFPETTVTWNNKDTYISNCSSIAFNETESTNLGIGWYNIDITSILASELQYNDGLFVVEFYVQPKLLDGSPRDTDFDSDDSANSPYISFLTSVAPSFSVSLLYPNNNQHYNDYTGFINITTTLNSTCVINDSRWVSVVNQSLCFQEQPNVATSCGGLDTGTFSYTDGWSYFGSGKGARTIDTSYSTFASFNAVGAAVLWINYSKPPTAYDAIWRVMIDTVITNVSIPNDCWYNDPNLLLLRAESPAGPAFVSCYNGTVWNNIFTGSGAAFFEEGIYWLFGKNHSFYNPGIIPDEEYSLIINCTSTNETAGISFSFFVDTNEPTIVVTNPKLDNTTKINSNLSLGLDIYTTDSYLYQANLTIINSTGGVMYNNWSGLLTTEVRYDWNGSVDTSTWFYGEYLVFVEATDSHTAKYIQPADVLIKPLTKELSYDFNNNEISIKLIDGNVLNQFDTVSTEKLTDRYTFDYKFKTAIKENSKLTFRVSSENKIYYIKDSKYNAHFVTGMNWIDFEGVEGDYKVKKVDDYNYDVFLITDKPMKDLSFESIGGLNYNSKNFTFNKQATLTIFANDSNINTTLSNFTVTYNGINYHTNGTNVSFYVDAQANATITINKTNYVPMTIITYIGSVNKTETVYLDSAGISFIVLDERTKDLISGINVSIDIIGVGNFSTTTGTLNVSGIPLGTVSVSYDAEGYHPRIYFLNLVSSGLSTVYLYLLNDSALISTRIILTTLDQDSDPANNITIKLQRFYPATNAYNVISMRKTNFEGEAHFYVELYDVFYKIQYERADGTIIKITDSAPFLKIDPLDVVNLLPDDFTSWASYNNVYYNLSFLNSSGTIFARFIFSDSNNIVRSGCLRVDRLTTTEIIPVCYNCTSGSAATLTCIVDPTKVGEYKAVALIDTLTENSWYPVSLGYYKVYANTNVFAAEGLFFGAMVAGTMGLMGLATITSSLLLLVLGVIGTVILGLVYGVSQGFIWYIVSMALCIIFMVRLAQK